MTLHPPAPVMHILWNPPNPFIDFVTHKFPAIDNIGDALIPEKTNEGGRARQTRGAGGRGGVRQKLQVQRDTSRDLNVERATGVKSSNLQETIFVIHCGRGSIRSLPPVMNLSGLRQRRTQLLHPLAKNLYSAQENRFLINPAFGRV